MYLEFLGECVKLAGGAGGWLEAEAIRIHELIDRAALSDPRKLRPDPSGPLRVSSNDEFEAEVDFVLKFAQDRFDWVKQSLDAAWAIHYAGGLP
jgi:hypothetical protein